MQLLDRSSVQVVEAVRSGEAEVGIGLELTSNPDLVEETMLRDPFVLYCRRDHPASTKREIAWKALREYDLIAISGSSGNRTLLDHHLQRHGIDLRGRYEVEHPSTAVSLIAVGVGAAVLPSATLLPDTFPDVKRIKLGHPVIQRTIVRFMRRGATLSPAAQAFYDALDAALLRNARAMKGGPVESLPSSAGRTSRRRVCFALLVITNPTTDMRRRVVAVIVSGDSTAFRSNP